MGADSTFVRGVGRTPRLRDQWASLLQKMEALESDLEAKPQPKPTPRMCQLLIEAEDHRFALHPGVDPLALCRAFWRTYLRGSRQGGSTIAMQLVRTLTGRRERTWQRKTAEILLAVKLTAIVPRARIPIYYLWVAYYGWDMEGFPRVCSRLGLNPSTSTLEEDAQLIARLKYPQPRYPDLSQINRIRSRGHHIAALAVRRKTVAPLVLHGEEQCALSR